MRLDLTFVGGGRGQGDGQLPDLALEAQVGLEADRAVDRRDVVGGEVGVDLGCELLRATFSRSAGSNGTCSRTARMRSRRTSAVAAPKAESTEASAGTRTRRLPMASPMAGVKSPPQPPKERITC